MLGAPRCGHAAHLLERARLLEEMRGAGHDFQLRGRRHPPHGVAIELDDRLIGSTDDEQRRRFHEWKGISGKIGPPTARDDGLHAIRSFRRRYECGRGARTGAETAHGQPANVRVSVRPVNGSHHTVPEACDIETKLQGPLVNGVLLLCEQIEHQRREPASLEEFRHLPVAAAETAAAAAVGEDDEAGGPLRYPQIAIKKDACGR